MPRAAKYQVADLQGWQKGLNLQADSSRLEPEELSLALNVKLGHRGEVRLRTGYTRVDDGSLTEVVSFIYPFRTKTYDDWLICISNVNGNIWYGESVTFFDSGKDSPLGTTLQTWGHGFASAKGKLYVTCKQMLNPVSFDGTLWADVTGTMPSAKMFHWRHDRMLALNTTERPSAVYYSATEAPEQFATDDWFPIDDEDGYEINASQVFGDDLIMFKDHAVWKLSGRTPSSFATYELDTHRGCVSPRAVTQLRGRLLFFDRDTGIWAFDGAQFELISQPINDYILEGQNYDRNYGATAYVGEDRAYFSLYWGNDGDPRRSFVYHGDTGAWTEYDNGFAGRQTYLNERYLGLVGAPGIYIADEASSLVPPSGTKIVGRFRTGWALIAGPGIKARVQRLEMTVKANVPTNVTVRMFGDHDETTPLVTRTFVGGAGPRVQAIESDERRVTLDGWGPRVHAVMFEFETDDFPFQLNEMSVFYTGGQDVRGER